MSRTHFVIPDCQVKPGAPTDHLTWIGKYILHIKPEVIVNLGDFADMHSLSQYDKGKLSFEGRRYQADLGAAHNANRRLLKPLNEYNEKRRRFKEKLYQPEKHMLYGNHEHRVCRAIEDDAKMDGFMGLPDLQYEKFGWTTHQFLDVVNLDGIHYSHFFYNPNSGRPFGGMVESRLKQIGFSFTQGHEQGKKIGAIERNNGEMHRGLVVGSCYLHTEDYKGPQGNSHWRGIIVKREVRNGDYDLCEVSLDYLCRRYEGCHVWEFMKRNYPEIYAESAWLKRAEFRATHRLEEVA